MKLQFNREDARPPLLREVRHPRRMESSSSPKITGGYFFQAKPPPRLHVSFPPAGTSLKFNISPAGTPTSPDRHPPSNESLQPMATGPGYHGDSFAWQVAAATADHPLPAPTTLHLLQTRLFCLPPVRRTNRAQRKNIQSRVKNSRAAVVVVVVSSVSASWGVARSGGRRIESPWNPLVFTPPLLRLSDQGWRSMAVEVETPLPTEGRQGGGGHLPPFKYDGIIKCLRLHIQNQWLHTFDVQRGGWDLLSSDPRPRPRDVERGRGWHRTISRPTF